MKKKCKYIPSQSLLQWIREAKKKKEMTKTIVIDRQTGQQYTLAELDMLINN